MSRREGEHHHGERRERRLEHDGRYDERYGVRGEWSPGHVFGIVCTIIAIIIVLIVFIWIIQGAGSGSSSIIGIILTLIMLVVFIVILIWIIRAARRRAYYY
jgi:amino acid transporter